MWATFYTQYTLTVGTPADFATSQWQDPAAVSWCYVVFSVVSALYLNVELVVKMLTPVEHGGWWAGAHHASHFFLYLTNWTQCLLASSTLGAALLAIEHVHRVRQGSPLAAGRLPLRYRCSWLLHNASAALALAVTLAFWPSMFEASAAGQNSISYFTVSSHGGNSLFVLLLLVIHRVPRRPLHVLQPVCVAAAYLVFTVVYTELGGLTERADTAFYPVLDWRREPVVAALFAFDLVIGAPISFFAVVALAVVREAAWRRWRRVAGEVDEETPVAAAAAAVGYQTCP